MSDRKAKRKGFKEATYTKKNEEEEVNRFTSTPIRKSAVEARRLVMEIEQEDSNDGDSVLSDNSDLDPDFTIDKRRSDSEFEIDLELASNYIAETTSTREPFAEQEAFLSETTTPVSFNGVGELSEGDHVPGVSSIIETMLAEPPLTSEAITAPDPEIETVSTHSNKRKRKTPKQKADQEIQKRLQIREKHSVLEGCTPKCSKNCRDIFSEDQRRELNRWFWGEDWKDQRKFVRNCVRKTECKYRGEDILSKEKIAKSCTYKYTMRHEDGVFHPVCKMFFLTTLGFKANNDKLIRSAFKDVGVNENNVIDVPLVDNRGRHSPWHKIDHSIIHEHIEKYKPSISHYRREHAPFGRYLPFDLTITDMHQNFCEVTGKAISEKLYYCAFKELNISRAVLGQEECEKCKSFLLHKHLCDCEERCEPYAEYVIHRKRYRNAREKYQSDADRNENDTTHPVFAADLQKVMLLPRMNQFKRSIFTSRLVVFNETFAPVGCKTNERDIAVIWNESISGRKDEDLASAFYQFLVFKRDAESVTLWLDNCSGQNKNWTLFTMLLHLVNNETTTQASTITLNYFEPGHTFMAADSSHARIDKVLKREDGKIIDFNDFEQCVV